MPTQKANILEIFLIYATVILILLSTFLYFLLRQQKKLRKLELEKVTAEIDAGNKERNKIATEIHNDIAPYLISVIYMIHQLKTTDDTIKDKLLNALSDCLQKMRMAIKEISPLEYYGVTFQEAVESYINSHNFEKNLDIDLIYKLDFDHLSNLNTEIVFRIIQEILLNTIKHANAKQLKIQMEVHGGKLLIKTADDGIGYKPDVFAHKVKKKGYGLISILNRVEYLNGTFEHDQSGLQGTRYIISIPLERSLG